MKMSKNKKTIIHLLYLLIVPILLSAFSLIIAKSKSFDYNKTLITNVVESLDDGQRIILKFDNKQEKLDDWETYANVFNRDFYGANVLFRVSKNTFHILGQSENIVFSDIKQCDMANNTDHNFSSLSTNSSMNDFQENSIIISQPLALSIGVNIGDLLVVETDKKEYEFSIFDIYDQTSTQKRYINNSYLEFDIPVCFVSSSNFNELSSDEFDGYVSIGSNKTYINPTYVELTPIFSKNNASLIVLDNFSLNDFKIQNQTFKSYQEMLLNAYQSHNTASYYIFVVFLVVFFVENSVLTYEFVSKILSNNKCIYKHNIICCFIYSLFVVLVSIGSILLLKNLFTVVNNGAYTLYYSLTLPLKALTAFVILQISLVIISTVLTRKKLDLKSKILRKSEINRLQEKNNKVIFVTGSLTRGGAEKVIVELANYYASLGRKVDIVILLNNEVSWELNTNIHVVNFTGTTNSRIKRIRYWLSSLKNYFKQNQGATIVSFLVRVNILVLLTAKKENHKIIVSERNDPRFDGRGLIVRTFTSFLYPKADKIIFQTKECKELFSSEIQSKGVIIPNPITIKKYASPTKYNDNLFVSAGRICNQKNQITMIRAMKIVVREHPQTRLDIYGDGTLTDKLKEKIKKLCLADNVAIHPNTLDINNKILNAKAYISTSLYEGMSNSLMEASFAGVPCITTKCLGTDFVKDNINGYFIPFQSPKKLAKVMIVLCTDSKLYDDLRKRTIDIARKIKFDDIYLKWKNCIDDE